MKDLPQKPPFFDDKKVFAQIEEYRKQEKTNEKRKRIAKYICFIILWIATDYIFVSGNIKSFNIVPIVLSIIPTFLVTIVYAFCIICLYQILFSWNIGKLVETLSKRKKESSPLYQLEKKYKEYLNYERDLLSYYEDYEGFEKYNFNREEYIKDKIEIVVNEIQKELATLDKMTEKEWWVELTPENFEIEVSRWFFRQGYYTETTSYVADGGVDVIATKDEEKLYIQCKHYNKNSPVGVSVVRELYGVVMADKATKGILVCLYPPTQGAINFANNNGIEIITADNLASKSDNAIRLNKDVRYDVRNAVIGQTSPYVFVGNVGIIFNVFHSKKDAQDFKEQQVLKQFPYATCYYFNKLYFILCSNDSNITKMNFYNEFKSDYSPFSSNDNRHKRSYSYKRFSHRRSW